MPRALKVYRTSTGFYDAYVAATTKKAALRAWGAGKDLFAIGAAELVTDPALTAEPLASPGTVVKRSRGNLAQQLAAMPPSSARKPTRTQGPAAKPSAAKKPASRPSRSKLDAAEAAAQAFERQAEAELADIHRREKELQQERKAVESRQTATAAKLAEKVARVRQQYDTALAKWRET
jgi:hypothetical protein